MSYATFEANMLVPIEVAIVNIERGFDPNLAAIRVLREIARLNDASVVSVQHLSAATAHLIYAARMVTDGRLRAMIFERDLLAAYDISEGDEFDALVDSIKALRPYGREAMVLAQMILQKDF